MSYYKYDRGYTPWWRRLGPWISIGVILAIIALVIWFVLIVYMDVGNVFLRWWDESVWTANLFPNGIKFAVLTWVVIDLLLLIGVRVVWAHGTLVRVASIVALLVAVFITVVTIWDNDKDAARAYGTETVFVVEDLEDTPRSLNLLANTAQKIEAEECNGLRGTADVFGCIEEYDFPTNWNRRVASATGAHTVMSRTSGDVPNTYLMRGSLTYLYGEGEGAWTAVRDGINRQSVYGIVSWDGSGNQPHVCRFEGDYSISYAFEGRWGRNLDDEIAGRYRNLLYDKEDIWGYCDEAKPVIVIPVTKQEGYNTRTVRTAAGVLVIKGSPSGNPSIEHIESVEADEFPGPVYPTWLVDKQRDAIKWAAGRANKNRLKFGYEDTNVSSQTGNTQNYLLQGPDGRTYWVTPVTPRSSESQQIVAFSVTPADEVTYGQLNQQRVYVLPDSDDAIVANLDDLNSRVTQAMSETNPGFFTGETPGRIAEFLPIDPLTWQVFAERNGRVVYRIDVPADARIKPTVYQLDGDSAAEQSDDNPATPTKGGPCGVAPAELSDADLASCLDQFANELLERQQQD